MKSRERVLKAMLRKEPDRVPILCHYTPEIQELLEKHTGLEGLDVNCSLGDDAIILWFGMCTMFNRTVQEGETYETEWGIRLTRHGIYNEVSFNPLANVKTVQEVNSHFFPDPMPKETRIEVQNNIQRYGDEYAVVGSVPLTIYEGAEHLRGYQQILEDILINRKIAETIFDRVMEYHYYVSLALIEMGIDILWLGDDMGTQRGMIISPQLWREIFKPRWRFLFESFKKKNSNLLIAYHSDGSIRPIIPDLIEIGLDILNPIQPLCEGMNSWELKKEYGKDLAFFGGIDIQEVLPFGTIEDVKAEVKKRIDSLAVGGGYLCGPTHNIQSDTPLENILTMYQTIKKFGLYPIRESNVDKKNITFIK